MDSTFSGLSWDTSVSKGSSDATEDTDTAYIPGAWTPDKKCDETADKTPEYRHRSRSRHQSESKSKSRSKNDSIPLSALSEQNSRLRKERNITREEASKAAAQTHRLEEELELTQNHLTTVIENFEAKQATRRKTVDVVGEVQETYQRRIETEEGAWRQENAELEARIKKPEADVKKEKDAESAAKEECEELKAKVVKVERELAGFRAEMEENVRERKRIKREMEVERIMNLRNGV